VPLAPAPPAPIPPPVHAASTHGRRSIARPAAARSARPPRPSRRATHGPRSAPAKHRHAQQPNRPRAAPRPCCRRPR
jgi:hypothetical protein